ncbi:hypothetical protein [Cognatishimia sp. F0-27]|uniref:hypothetical protein n=1 Tax=Cognatishimia sp. F0-27 TaxID=2816855 RepID=UPI001D0C86DF|nr:hypothetical protein [Cognatishimia sp. F0-27]MCC1492309.1 hypothetical protein [Cognatishimia sp. F0-27]
MIRSLILVSLVASVSGCGWLGIGRGGDVAFDGQYYRGNASSEQRLEKQYFMATVGPVSNSFEGARAAAQYEAIKHCIKYFGTSNIDWEVGPNTPDSAIMVDGDEITYMGVCEDR